MSAFDNPLPLNKLPRSAGGFDGDQLLISTDQSILRQGTWSSTPTGNFYSLVGNQPIMAYWSHNTGLDQNGNFLPRDEADYCSIFAFCEDNTIRLYGAPSAARHTLPAWTLSATFNMITGSITPSSTGGIIGTFTNNNVTAGGVGEYVTGTAAPGAVSLTTATSATVTSISLSAGDWDVDGVVNYTPGATTSITIIGQGASSTAATLGAQDTYTREAYPATIPTAIVETKQIPTQRFSLASTTTIYLVAQATFTASTLTAGGTIRARRVR